MCHSTCGSISFAIHWCSSCSSPANSIFSTYATILAWLQELSIRVYSESSLALLYTSMPLSIHEKYLLQASASFLNPFIFFCSCGTFCSFPTSSNPQWWYTYSYFCSSPLREDEQKSIFNIFNCLCATKAGTNRSVKYLMTDAYIFANSITGLCENPSRPDVRYISRRSIGPVLDLINPHIFDGPCSGR